MFWSRASAIAGLFRTQASVLFDVKTRLNQLLERVSRRETTEVTRSGGRLTLAPAKCTGAAHAFSYCLRRPAAPLGAAIIW